MKKVIVIGAGIAGLSTSIFLKKAGLDVHLFEKNSNVGGLCSGYYVNDFYVDHCLHWLMGTNKSTKLYKLWNEVGALTDDTPIISLPSLGDFIFGDTIVTFGRDLDKTEEEWIKISPQDKKAIKRLFASIKDVSSVMNTVLKEPISIRDRYQAIAALKNSFFIYKSMIESRKDYSKKFKHPALKFAIEHAQTGFNNMFFFLDLYGVFANGNADIPAKGALYMTKRMEEKFLSLGGHLYLNSDVQEIVIENNIATGIKVNNKLVKADVIVSCLDPEFTTTNLLKNQYRHKKLDSIKQQISKYPISSCYSLYVTIEGDISNIAVPTCLSVDKFKVGKSDVDSILIRPYYFDKCFIKDNKTVVSIFVDQNQEDYNYFKSLSESDYGKELERIDNQIISIIENRYPFTKGKIEFLTHFSPLELNKRSNTSWGALQGYSFSSNSKFYIIKPTLQKLSNFYLCSQLNRSIGGTPTALESADSISKLIIKKYKKVK